MNNPSTRPPNPTSTANLDWRDAHQGTKTTGDDTASPRATSGEVNTVVASPRVTTERYSYATFSGTPSTGVKVESERLAAYFDDRHGDVQIGDVSVSHAEAAAFCRAVLVAVEAVGS